MEKEETDEIKKIDSEINRLEIIAESAYNQINKLKEKKKFYELLPQF